MGTKIDSRLGYAVLLVAHCAGMVDLVALPLWVGMLISELGFDPRQAGGLVTLFLGGVVLSSIALASQFHRLAGRRLAALGFGAAAGLFACASSVRDYGTLAALHAASGVATGVALSVTHGTIARSARPHRLMALGGAAIGVFALVFMAVTPQILAAAGGTKLYLVFSAVMIVAALAAAAAFPTPAAVQPEAEPSASERPRSRQPIPRNVWFGIAGVSSMTIVQAMTFSFLERAGMDRGFGAQAVAATLIAVGVVNLLPGPLAAILERRLPVRAVLLAGPLMHAAFAASIMTATSFMVYTVAAPLFVAVLVFTHIFAFGLLARMDPSSRALAGTPAMLMAGSAIGPVLGGTLVKFYGYGSLGIAAAAIAVVAVFCFSRLPSAAPIATRSVLA